MLSSGASHNLIPRAIMEKLGLNITRPYTYLYSFDSSKVRCLGLIKDFCVTLVQIPAKSLVMDIVVVDIPPMYGMLLSRSWEVKLQGTLQMDMTYASILVFGQPIILYMETLMKYMVSIQDKPNNYPLYSVHSDMDSFILSNNECVENEVSHLEYKIINKEVIKLDTEEKYVDREALSNKDFDGVVSKDGVGVGVFILNSSKNMAKGHCYKLNFQCTYNIVEYEALILGLQILKRLGEKQIYVHGDSKLIINQIKGEYVAKHITLRAYRNAVLDFLQ